MNVEIPHDFTPRLYQLRPMYYLDQGGRHVFWVVHRRGGKDLTMMHQTCKMMHRRKGVYWHVFPTFAQARKAIWEGFRKDGKRIMENVFPGFLEPKRPGSIVKRKDEQQMLVELKCGSIWRLLGSDRIEVVGAGPVGVVFSEYALSNPRARHMIRPMLRENDGWEAYITTPRGRNHAKELYDSVVSDPLWFCEVQTLRDTRAYDPEKTVAEERAAGMPDALIQQEYFCDWNAALVGAIWGDLLNEIELVGGMQGFEHPDDFVFTSWDLGMTDATAIWFWRVSGSKVDVIDFYEERGKPLSHYFDLVESKPYKYLRHWLPHDARQVSLSSGMSILNQCLKRWPGKVSVTPDLPLLDGIQAGRWVLQQGIRFHPRCSEGVEALRQYHYDYDEEKRSYKASPAHDWTSHAADAFRYLATSVRMAGFIKPPVEKAIIEPGRMVQVPSIDNTFKLDDLFMQRERQLRQRRRI